MKILHIVIMSLPFIFYCSVVFLVFVLSFLNALKNEKEKN